MTLNDQLRDEAILHSLHSQKYGEGLADKIVRLLNSADARLVEKIAAKLARIEQRGQPFNPDTIKRLESLLEEIRFINDAIYKKVADGLNVELTAMATVEASIAAKTVTATIFATAGVRIGMALPPPTLLKTLASKTVMTGTHLRPWTEHLSRKRTDAIGAAINTGIAAGDSADDIVRTIRGTKANGYKDGLLQASRKSAKDLVLTANAAVANQSRLEVYKRNTDVIGEVEWLSVLDPRTSQICQSLDGKTWKIDEPHPQVPQHIRCRSFLLPKTRSYEELGIDKAEPERMNRASVDGPVNGRLSYGPWLKKQSKARQEEVLGIERARMFRNGEATFEQLFTKGKYKNLSELKAATNR